jgi:hypothetical protein
MMKGGKNHLSGSGTCFDGAHVSLRKRNERNKIKQKQKQKEQKNKRSQKRKANKSDECLDTAL